MGRKKGDNRGKSEREEKGEGGRKRPQSELPDTAIRIHQATRRGQVPSVWNWITKLVERQKINGEGKRSCKKKKKKKGWLEQVSSIGHVEEELESFAQCKRGRQAISGDNGYGGGERSLSMTAL